MDFAKNFSVIIFIATTFITTTSSATTISAESWGNATTIHYNLGVSYGAGSSANSYSKAVFPPGCELVSISNAYTRWGNFFSPNGYWVGTTPTFRLVQGTEYSINWNNGNRDAQFYKDWDADFSYRCKGEISGKPKFTIETLKRESIYETNSNAWGKSASINFPSTIELGDIPTGRSTHFTHVIKPENITGKGRLRVCGVLWTSGAECRTDNTQVWGIIKANGDGDITPKNNYTGAFSLPINVSIELE